MSHPTPRVGVPSAGRPEFLNGLRSFGAEPVPLALPPARPSGGVALSREWVADATEVLCAEAGLDALLLAAAGQKDLFGMLLAAVRLDLPAVCDAPSGSPLSAALTALGVSPPAGEDTANAAAKLAAEGGPRPGDLLDNFSLANALRAGVAAGAGPELLVHLSALAREAGVAGFAQMARVLAPETDAGAPEWTAEHGVPNLLASLGDALHDIPTVSGLLKEGLPDAPPVPAGHGRYVVLRARASGAEAVCLAPAGVSEVAGECRVFASEKEAVRAVVGREVGAGDVLVVPGYGPRGGPGLSRLDALGGALLEGGVRTTVLTDGVAPEGAPGVWASLFTPEAAVGGVMVRLRDGDALRLDLDEGRIRTGVPPEEFRAREPLLPAVPSGKGYAARYARSALPALEGAGFG